MKKFLFLFFTPLALMYACSEDQLDTYDGKDFIYFSMRRESSAVYYWDTLKSFNFYFYPGLEDTVYRIPVSTGGRLYEHDRAFLIDVQVEGGAIEGTDFEISRTQIIPAGQNGTDIPVTLHKTDKLEGNTYSLNITLLENEAFTIELPEVIHDRSGDTIQRTSMVLEWKAELDKPETYDLYGVGYFGYWSIAKYLEMSKLWGTTIEDWATRTDYVITNGINLAVVFANHLNAHIAMGQEYAIKDPSPDSHRGYMVQDGTYGSYYGIPDTSIPAEWDDADGWLGGSGN